MMVYWYAFIAMIAGTAYYSYVIGSVSAIVNQTDTVRQNYLEKMDRVFSYMKHNRLPRRMQRKIIQAYKRHFSDKTALADNGILDELDAGLKQEVAEYLCHKAVSTNLLFSELPKGMLLKLGSVLKPVTVEQGDDIVTAGEEGTDMYILLQGAAVVVSGDDNRTILANVAEGASFGEVAAFGISLRRTATVRAIVDCELYRLGQEDMRASFRDVPAVYEKMRLSVMQNVVRGKFLGPFFL